MEPFIIKIFALVLALGQVAATPETIRTEFDRASDQSQVAGLLRAGCAHMRKVFGIEGLDLDDLITTALDDPQALAGDSQLFRGINFGDMQEAYRQFCKNQKGSRQVVDLGAVIDFYNKAAANLPDHTRLKGMQLPNASMVLDNAGKPFAELSEENRHRVWIPLAEIPAHVQSTFIAAEDRRFYEHRGIDERGLVRAFVGNLAKSGRPQGGSTITQQLVKNVLVGDDVSYERKIREMILASKVERLLSKPEILEVYLNTVYVGRGAWGIEAGAEAYFGKRARELTLQEGALLATLIKGPSYFNPDRHPRRVQERFAYVIGRLQEDGVLDPRKNPAGYSSLPVTISRAQRRGIGYYFSDQVAREAKSLAGIDANAAQSYVIRSTINQKLQQAVEEAVQEGLSRYERNAGRAQFKRSEANLAETIRWLEADKAAATTKLPAWQRALVDARLPLYDVHWTPAVVIDKATAGRGGGLLVGLGDGRILPLAANGAATERKLAPHDVVLVQIEGQKKARASLRVRPEVQGAALVLENATGRILAMTGGFSYPLSQLNRVTQAVRQPGSAVKPLSYLAALGRGAQPNTLISDEALTLPPIGKKHAAAELYWTPKNYDGGSGGVLTLRTAVEKSRNLATAHLLLGGIEQRPEDSLTRLCDLAMEAMIYRDCVRFYPFVLGAQPVRPLDLAAFYAAIATEGLRPMPYAIESIERRGEVLYRHQPTISPIQSVDEAAFYQLKTILQGVVARGTAAAIADLAPYVAGKTGTSNDGNDVWFVGFTNDVTVAVWIGYDNADGKRRTLGEGATGGSLAVPIFESIIKAAWANGVPKTVLAPPSPEAKQRLACKSSGRRSAFSECFRIDAKGRVLDRENILLSRKGWEPDRDLVRIARAPAPSSLPVIAEDATQARDKLAANANASPDQTASGPARDRQARPDAGAASSEAGATAGAAASAPAATEASMPADPASSFDRAETTGIAEPTAAAAAPVAETSNPPSGSEAHLAHANPESGKELSSSNVRADDNDADEAPARSSRRARKSARANAYAAERGANQADEAAPRRYSRAKAKSEPSRRIARAEARQRGGQQDREISRNRISARALRSYASVRKRPVASAAVYSRAPRVSQERFWQTSY